MSEFRKKPAGHGTVLLGHYHPGQQINSLTGQVAVASWSTVLNRTLRLGLGSTKKSTEIDWQCLSVLKEKRVSTRALYGSFLAWSLVLS